MLELTNNQLVFRFPEVHPEAVLTIVLHRTFRIPDDGKEYPLPPSLGSFPMVHIDDYKTRVPEKWVGRGGVMVPMYQSEALWFSLIPGHVREHGVQYPFAIKCATGKVSAITGKEWKKKLKADDYMVAPGQPWLDGYVVADGTIRQFVAAPLGLGVTAEGQITGKEEFGGLQLEVIPMLRGKFEAKFPKMPRIMRSNVRRRGLISEGGITGPTGPQGAQGASGPTGSMYSAGGINYCYNGMKGSSMSMGGELKCSLSAQSQSNFFNQQQQASLTSGITRSLECELSEIGDNESFGELVGAQLDMGLAAGGRMRQQVFKDPHGIECWDTKNKTRVFVHLANSLGWQHMTGALPPHPPLSAAQYTSHGYPWFHYYEENAKSQQGTDKLKGLKSLAEIQKEKKTPLLPENQSTPICKNQVVEIPPKKGAVRDGSWAK